MAPEHMLSSHTRGPVHLETNHRLQPRDPETTLAGDTGSQRGTRWHQVIIWVAAPSLVLAGAAAAAPAARLRSLTPRRPGRSPERPIGSISKEGEHGEDSAVVVRSGCQAELCEDRADVGLHGARAQIKLGADGVIGSAFCHETEHVAL